MDAMSAENALFSEITTQMQVNRNSPLVYSCPIGPLFLWLSLPQSSAGLSCLNREWIDGLQRHMNCPGLLEGALWPKIAIFGKQGKDPSSEALTADFCHSLFQHSIADEHFPLGGFDGTGSDAAELNLLPYVCHPHQSLMILEPDYFLLILVCGVHISKPRCPLQPSLKRSC